MEFEKDILIIDFEGQEEPVQIGAVLLDKKTLEEKDCFKSYIWTDLKGEIKKTSGITQEMLEGAPSRAEAGKMFHEKFGTDVFLAGWVVDLDRRHFKKLITEAGIDIEEYNYHILDIWPAAYIHLLKQGYQGGINSEAMFQEFGAEPRDLHDALEDCRIAADVLRKIIQK